MVIDTSGVSSLIEEGIEATCARSRVVLVGMTRPEYKLEVNVLDHLQVGCDLFATRILLTKFPCVVIERTVYYGVCRRRLCSSKGKYGIPMGG